ncbi:MAG: Omp28-related outer membrane protein [Bacteroidetes bacterium]|nr:Omp28-related outer membrane protein [Bacteroidota bacterium]
MKKSNFIYLLLTSFLIIGSLSAQTPKWVSTEVQNRTAVLEHFTGIHCSGCTKGYKIADELLKLYPDKFIIINNHSGIRSNHIYPEQFDFRTEEGDLIYSNSRLYIYITEEPDGAINRSTEPWSIFSDEWESTAVDIMNQPSIVNIYVKTDINFTTRELIVEVEYYYTSDSPASENYLTVMLLQNEIVGHQDGGKKYYPEYVVNDSLYRHNHVLRKVLSNDGAFGEPITNTKKGSYECRKYRLLLPDSIRNVPLELKSLNRFCHTNLEVVAFISESKSNIYTGYKSAVEIPKSIRTDLKVEDVTDYHNTLKFEPIHPKIKVTNNSDLPVTKFDMEYTLSNIQDTLYFDYIYNAHTKKIYDTIISKSNKYYDILKKGESFIFEYPEITWDAFNTASNYISHAFVSNAYSYDVLLLDVDTTDNTSDISKICLLDTSFSETEISFESSLSTLTNTIPVHTFLDKSFNSYFAVRKPSDLGYNIQSCGAKNTRGAVMFLLSKPFHVADKPGYIMFGEIDCKDNPNKVLTYYYSYCYGLEIFKGTAPKIITEISKDWGQSWQRISEITCEEYPWEKNTEIFIPTSSQYKYVQINLYDYVKENFIIRIGCIPGSDGDVLWIDEISIKNADNEGIEENTKLSVYPNPATNILHINNSNLLGEEYEIYDLSGKLIIKDINNSNIINVENLSAGTYSLKIKDSIFNFIKE